jgi:hypothetical protein
VNEKMEHELAREALSPYLEGELEPEGKKALEEHLKSCLECRRQLELLRRSLELVRRLPAPRAPEEFAPRLKAMARRRGLIGRRRRPEPPRWLLSFEATLLLFLVTAGSVLLLVYFMELPPALEVRPPSLSLVLPGRERLADLFSAVRQCQGMLLSGQRLLAPDRPLGENEPLALVLDAGRIDCLREKLAASDLDRAMQGAGPPAAGLLVIPVIFSGPEQPPRVPEGPASGPGRH